MDVDKDFQGRGTPPGKTFDDGFTTLTTRGQTKADPTGSVHTENYFTPLYNEPQTTDLTNINHQPPTPETTRDAEMAITEEAAATEADAREAKAAAANAAKLIALGIRGRSGGSRGSHSSTSDSRGCGQGCDGHRSTTRGQTTAGATGSVHTENYFTPLYNESQTTDHSNVNINQQPPTPETTRDVEMAAAAEATTAESEESAVATTA